MATVSKEIAEKIIDADGHYLDDPQVQAVVCYYSSLSKHYEFALIYPMESIQRYGPSHFVIEPKFIWAAPQLRNLLIQHLQCKQCKKPFTSATVKTALGWRETQITGFCELCWNEIFKDPEDEQKP